MPETITTTSGGGDFHRPVMAAEVIDGLVTDPSGVYVDATVGGGGHSRAILRALDSRGTLIGLDRDGEALREAVALESEFPGRVILVRGAFRDLSRLMDQAMPGRDSRALRGILFDLGVSSHQIDMADRGFSYRQDGPLDMRMDRSTGVPAAEMIAHVSEADLAGIIWKYGEERGARRIARSICRLRDRHGLSTTEDLRMAVADTGPSHPNKTLARVFQAVRMQVNDELSQLDSGLNSAIESLPTGGRLAVISYHSLEDRLVKVKLTALMRGCVCPPRMPVCGCGRKPQFRSLHRKALRASREEVAGNRRARSAVLRISERIRSDEIL